MTTEKQIVDAIGNPVDIGAQVVWAGGKGQMAGMKQATVDHFTKKRVIIRFPSGYRIPTQSKQIVVIDRLLP